MKMQCTSNSKDSLSFPLRVPCLPRLVFDVHPQADLAEVAAAQLVTDLGDRCMIWVFFQRSFLFLSTCLGEPFFQFDLGTKMYGID